MQVWSKRILPGVLTVAILAIAALPAAQAQTKDEITALNKRAVQLFGEGKYAEAVALAEKLLKARDSCWAKIIPIRSSASSIWRRFIARKVVMKRPSP